jgi:uncharacterized SAM-binding protein YcdF (DUF218 family)
MKLAIVWIILAFGAAIAGLIGIGVFLAPADELQKSDAVIAVSGGDTRSRTLEAVKLYQEGWAPLLIFSGAARDINSQSNAAAMRDIALSRGVPSDVIVLDEASLTTRQNANVVSNIVEAFNFQRVILVTSPYHQRRVSLEFGNRLGAEVEIINHPAPDDDWSRSYWWRTPQGWYFTFAELPRTLFSLVTK